MIMQYIYTLHRISSMTILWEYDQHSLILIIPHLPKKFQPKPIAKGHLSPWGATDYKQVHPTTTMSFMSKAHIEIFRIPKKKNSQLTGWQAI